MPPARYNHTWASFFRQLQFHFSQKSAVFPIFVAFCFATATDAFRLRFKVKFSEAIPANWIPKNTIIWVWNTMLLSLAETVRPGFDSLPSGSPFNIMARIWHRPDHVRSVDWVDCDTLQPLIIASSTSRNSHCHPNWKYIVCEQMKLLFKPNCRWVDAFGEAHGNCRGGGSYACDSWDSKIRTVVATKAKWIKQRGLTDVWFSTNIERRYAHW